MAFLGRDSGVKLRLVVALAAVTAAGLVLAVWGMSGRESGERAGGERDAATTVRERGREAAFMQLPAPASSGRTRKARFLCNIFKGLAFLAKRFPSPVAGIFVFFAIQISEYGQGGHPGA